MKVLFLAPYPPYPPRGGGQQRMYHLIRHAARDHEVWLLTFSPLDSSSEALAPLHDFCHIVTVPSPRHTLPRRLRTLICSPLPDMALRGRSAAFQATLDDLLKRVPFDVVQAESIEMAQYGRHERAGHGPLYVYDSFNAEYLIQRRAFWTDLRHVRSLPAACYSAIQWQKLRRYESRLDCRFGGTFAVSREDAAILRSLTPQLRIAVVPNGVDTIAFQRGAEAQYDSGAPYVLFTGTLDYRANVDAVRWFAEEILPLVKRSYPQVRFAIVGRKATTAVRELADRPGVDLVGEVDDVRPWFDRAAAYVVPMRIGGGVRFKVLEALAMEQAVVSTSMGVEGIEGFVPDTHARIANDPRGFAAHVCALVSNRNEAQRLGSAGRALVVERYDWQAIAPRMVACWEAWR